jgi:hypothetical protein
MWFMNSVEDVHYLTESRMNWLEVRSVILGLKIWLTGPEYRELSLNLD